MLCSDWSSDVGSSDLLGSSPLGLQERALGGVGGELDRSVVGLDGRHLVAGAGQEVGSGGVVGLVVGEGGAVDRLQHFQSDLGAVELAHGDGSVHGHHGVGPDGEELVVELDDLRPVGGLGGGSIGVHGGSEEHTSELQSLMRISYAVFCLKKKNKQNTHTT